MTDDLTRYPRPNVAVDLALLTAVLPPDDRPGHLAVLLQSNLVRPDEVALPGRFLRKGQTVVEAMGDVLRDKVRLDVTPTRPLLLGVFDDPRRDPRGWTISLAHALALPQAELPRAHGLWIPVDLRGRVATRLTVLFDHAAMIEQAARAIRERYERRPDPDGLLSEPFTLAQLRHVHEAVLGERLQRDTFDRRMKEHLVATGERSREAIGRPAMTYRHRLLTVLSDSEQRRLRLPRIGD